MNLLDLRSDFPILQTRMNNKPLVYLDNAATTQKPTSVIQSQIDFYSKYNASTHSPHELGSELTEKIERARQKIANFIQVPSPKDLIFTKGTTEGINLIAQAFGAHNLQPGDEILVGIAEHHSNYLPWVFLAQKLGLIIKTIPLNDSYQLDINQFQKLFTKKTKFVAVGHVSNVLGIANPISELITITHSHGAKILIDGAQAVSHIPIDISKLKPDFYVFSGHKMFGPTGIGVVYASSSTQELLGNYQVGGDMVYEVTAYHQHLREFPYRFEAGTLNYAGILGLEAAIDYLTLLYWPEIEEHESYLISQFKNFLLTIPEFQILQISQPVTTSLISFYHKNLDSFDIASFLSLEGIAIRSGQHCTGPLHEYLQIPNSLRVSVSIYNTSQEIEFLIQTIQHIMNRLR